MNALFDDDLELLKAGEVWYKGWEICDKFFICRRKSSSKLVIACENGHNQGMVLDGPSRTELSEFFDQIEVDEDNLALREQFTPEEV